MPGLDLLGRPFRLASRLRRARVFHPDGVVLAGGLAVHGDGLAGSPLLAPGRRAPALVRLSRGVGLPERWPDVLGVAVKVPDAGGPGEDQDVLLATVGRRGPLRRVLVPAGAFDDRSYSSLLAFDVGGRRLLLGATVDAGGRPLRSLGEAATAARERRLTVTLLAGDRAGRTWRPVAVVAPTDVLPGPEGRRLAFDPWHTGGGICPAGVLNRLRRPAYPASREGRAGR